MEELLPLVAAAAGWIGALCTATAYALVSRTSQSINMLGGALLAVSAAANGAWPSVTSNFVWVIIGMQTLVGVRRGLGVTDGR